MRVFAYCTRGARWAVRGAMSLDPVTSPPMTAEGFDPKWLEGHDVLYFRLHGEDGRVGWFGDGRILALARAQVEAADLGGAMCIVANCFGADDDPLVDALYRAGARAVIAGHGPNVAAGNRIVGADLLAMWILRGLRWGMEIGRALAMAKVRLLATAWRGADRDARKFQIVQICKSANVQIGKSAERE